MMPSVSELSREQGRSLLGALRQHVGPDAYEEMVREHGEDRLLQMILTSSEPPPAPKESWWGRWGFWVTPLVIAVVIDLLAHGRWGLTQMLLAWWALCLGQWLLAKIWNTVTGWLGF